jgi:hypothetical protein
LLLVKLCQHRRREAHFYRKGPVVVLFSLGLFVVSCLPHCLLTKPALTFLLSKSDVTKILASTLNRYYCFAHPDSIDWIYWYVREASTAVIVTNTPHCYALREVFSPGDSTKWIITDVSSSAASDIAGREV